MKQVELTKRERIKRRIRAKVSGTKKRPRLCIYKSNKFIYAQVIDDQKGHTLVSASDMKIKKGTKTERASRVGEEIAKETKKKKIGTVVFDRGGFKYMGRVKALAEGARKAGLRF